MPACRRSPSPAVKGEPDIGKINVFNNRVSSRQWQTQDIKDDATGQVYTFKLRALDELEQCSRREFGDKLCVRYLHGNYRDEAGDLHNAPETLALIEDEEGIPRPVEVSEEALQRMAELERMQGLKRDVFDDKVRDDVYGAKELAIIAVTAPSVWLELLAFMRKVKAEASQKKAPAVSVGTSPTLSSEPEAAIPS